MMCFGKNCFRFFVIISAILLAVFGIWFFLVCKSFADSELGEASETETMFMTTGIIVMLIMFIFMGIGIFSGITQKKLCLFFYILFVFLLCLTCFGLVYFMVYRSDEYTQKIEDICDDGNSDQWVEDLDAAYNPQKAAESPIPITAFICGLDCPCKADKAKFVSAQDKNHSGIYAAMNTLDTGARAISECPAYGDSIPEVSDRIKALAGYLEDTFDCAGLCERAPFYLFSTVGNGVPEKGCKDGLIEFIEDKFRLILIAAICSAIFTLIVFICSCALCCVERQQDKKKTPREESYKAGEMR